MKKVIFGIFAHPDDEAFGPSGALLKDVEAGAELHLVTLTDGGGGMNPDNLPNLGEVRLDEWRTAGALIGASSMHHLGYQDGRLCNTAMIEIAQKIETVVRGAIEGRADITVEFMSIDLNGITGHIDHIVAGRATCLAFYRLKQEFPQFITRIRLACVSSEFAPRANTEWIYMEQGRLPQEINETVDARDRLDDILAIIRAHHTQRGDGEAIIKGQGESLGLCHFLVRS